MQATLAYLHFKTLDSTHLWCKRELATVCEFLKKAELFLVTCDTQTAGIGRSGKAWKSGKRHLSMNLCFKTPPIKAANLSLTISDALSQWLQKQGIPSKLKWPNDIWTARGKIAGLILEVVHFEEESYCLVGMGLNISDPSYDTGHLSESFDPASIDQPTDFAERYLIQPINLSSLPIEISQYIHVMLEDQEISPTEINSFMNNSWTCPGATIEAIVEEGRIEGTILGFESQGDLILRTKEGKERHLRSGLCQKVRVIHAPYEIKTEIASSPHPTAHVMAQTLIQKPSNLLKRS